MGAFGTVTSETISGQDVTTEVADNGAQLATLQDEARATSPSRPLAAPGGTRFCVQ
jgi:hypothetical protein